MNPRPLSELSPHGIKAVFSDLDDTITYKSLLLPSTLEALHALHGAGLQLVIVSGRPAGWADALMRLLPLDGVIFENGAGLMWREQERIKIHCMASNFNLAQQKQILQDAYKTIQNHIPEVKLATDQPYRLFDYAIDFNEEPPFLNEVQTDWIMETLKKTPQVTAKLSSIHINYWVGNHTKLTACQYWLDRFGKSLNIKKENIIYSGDSPNDEPLFEFFPLSVGVANVRRFLSKMKTHPQYITTQEAGAGFQEIAELLVRSAEK